MINRRCENQKEELLVRITTRRGFFVILSSIILVFFFIGSTGTSASASFSSMGNVNQDDLAALEASAGIASADELAPPDEGLFYTAYRVRKGDTVSQIADTFDVTPDTIITFNDIRNSRSLAIGKLLKVPTMNGILYKTKEGDTVDAIAATYSISPARVTEINYLDSTHLPAGITVFLPDARLSSWALREINGDLFIWPIRGYITSWFGWRKDPFTSTRSYHGGLDIGSSIGTRIHAAMEGVVSATGYSTSTGNYIVISHHSGYSSLYAHLSKIMTQPGARVSTATVIGLVGNTGYSTGPHLHFSVSKYGSAVNPMTVLR